MKDLAEKISEKGFRCLRCGKCCSGDDNEVMVSPEEVDLLVKASGLSFDEIAEPYPSWIEESGAKFTFGWVLKRGEDGNCIFLKEKKCSVYNSRPHICRTYPFMLDGFDLLTSECEGVGSCKISEETEQTARDLLARRDAEDKEFELTKEQYQKHSIVKDSIIIFDSRGAHRINNKND
ncbi:MAG: YkgJ family cysteine cluster protein [Methanocorpusculum sp.]|nr:YkgJ family cysteine cluster protein [Methanocorpusculum sp.]